MRYSLILRPGWAKVEDLLTKPSRGVPRWQENWFKFRGTSIVCLKIFEKTRKTEFEQFQAAARIKFFRRILLYFAIINTFHTF